MLFTILDAKNKLELQIAVITSWIGAVLFAYITNRFYVFKSKSKDIFLLDIVCIFQLSIIKLSWLL